MTLVLTLGNREQIIQLSDRRLTVGGKLDDDESNKAVVLVCANARHVIGFTGLAKTLDLKFETKQWLVDALFDCCSPDCTFVNTIERLKERATHDFRTIPALKRLPQQLKRMSILFSGYLYNKALSPLAGYTLLSNYLTYNGAPGVRDHFEVFHWWERRPSEPEFSYVQRIGNWTAMNPADESMLRQMLIDQKPPRAIIGKAIELIREMADRPKAEEKIGKQLSIITLQSDLNAPISTDYYSNVLSHNIFYTSQVTCLSESNRTAMMDLEVGTQTPTESNVLAVPKVARNHLCPCHSGKKFKFCHGR